MAPGEFRKAEENRRHHHTRSAAWRVEWAIRLIADCKALPHVTRLFDLIGERDRKVLD
jgi:hypothetical protein